MEFSMQNFLIYLWQKIWILLTCGLICAFLSLVGTYILADANYEANISLYILNANNRTDTTGISISDINASQQLANTYIAILKSDTLLEAVANDLPQYSLSADSIRKLLTASTVNKTELINITVTSTNAEMTLDIIQSLQKLAPDVITRVVKAGSVEIVDAATKAKLADRPFQKNTLLGLCAGILAAVCVSLALFLFDTTIFDETSLMNRFQISILGIIPKDSDSHDKPHAKDSILSKNTPFAITEAYRAARVNILKLPITSSCKKLAITSARPGEGKSVTAINLSMVLAQDGYRVLLIDGDMRKPQIKNYLNLQDNIGFADYLLGTENFLEITKSDAIPLHILASGTTCSHPTEILTKNRMKKMLEKLVPSFDYIIIDTPPLDYVADAAALSDFVDGYLFVTKANYSKGDQIEDSIRKLELINAKIYGFFLNNVDPKHCTLGSRYHVYNYYDTYEKYET